MKFLIALVVGIVSVSAAPAGNVTLDSYQIVHALETCPKGMVRAMGRGLWNEDNFETNSWVALWVREDGENVFGRAWCDEDGKIRSAFAWGRKEVRGVDVGAYRVLTYIGPFSKNKFSYRWVKATTIGNPNTPPHASDLVTGDKGENSPAVVVGEDGQEHLGNANWDLRIARTARLGKGILTTGKDFDSVYLLVRDFKEPTGAE